MNKSAVHQAIVQKLQQDLDLLARAVEMARDAATHSENQARSKYETMATEASYLAQGQGRRLLEIQKALEYFLLNRNSIQTSTERVGLNSLCLLENEDGENFYVWVAEYAGGLRVLAGGEEIKVITPSSPLGQQLLKASLQDEIRLTIRGAEQVYRVNSIR